MAYNVPPLDEASDRSDSYLVRVEAYFEGNHITSATQKLAFLVSALRTKAIRVLTASCAPVKVWGLTYEDVLKHLDNYFTPKFNERAESVRLLNRRG